MKRVVSILLTIVLLLSVMPVSVLNLTASAATSGYYTYTVSKGEAEITDVSSLISGDITIPETLGGYPVTKIGNYAFSNCWNLESVTIPDSVITIGDRVFYYCESLESVTIPDSVITIGARAFSSCESLTSVTIGNSVTTIGDEAFYCCESLESITIPDSVTTIGDYAFYYCEGLESITIGNGVTSIGDYAFHYCKSLESVTIPDNITTIGDYVFANCDSIIGVTIPDGITTIGSSAFSFCKSLTSVIIPDSVTTIGDYAFRFCESLESITIPESVTLVGYDAFAWCSNNLTIYGYKNSEAELYAEENDIRFVLLDCDDPANIPSYYTYTVSKGEAKITDVDESISGDITVPSTLGGYPVTKIGDSAFADCYSLESITIPESVTTIGDSAFEWCDSLESVTIGNSVTTIGYDAFWWCINLESVTIGNSVTTIGDYAFDDCYSLESIIIPESVTQIGYDAFYYETIIKANYGSYAIDYAIENDYDYEILNAKSLSKAKVTLSSTKVTYNGEYRKPTVKLQLNGKTVSSKYYTVSYKDNKNPGKATVTIKAKSGNNPYTGSAKATLTILPKKQSISSLSSTSKKKLKVTIKKDSTVSGYKIYYSTSKSFKSYKSVTLYGASKYTKTLTNLKSRKTYYVRVKAFKKTSSGTIYSSSYSTVKSKKVK